jgi:hypothetical protein
MAYEQITGGELLTENKYFKIIKIKGGGNAKKE